METIFTQKLSTILGDNAYCIYSGKAVTQDGQIDRAGYKFFLGKRKNINKRKLFFTNIENRDSIFLFSIAEDFYREKSEIENIRNLYDRIINNNPINIYEEFENNITIEKNFLLDIASNNFYIGNEKISSMNFSKFMQDFILDYTNMSTSITTKQTEITNIIFDLISIPIEERKTLLGENKEKYILKINDIINFFQSIDAINWKTLLNNNLNYLIDVPVQIKDNKGVLISDIESLDENYDGYIRIENYTDNTVIYNSLESIKEYSFYLLLNENIMEMITRNEYVDPKELINISFTTNPFGATKFYNDGK